MSELNRRYDTLSPERRRLLEQKLKEKGLGSLIEPATLKPRADSRQASGREETANAHSSSHDEPVMRFSLFFFSDDGENDSGDKYRLLLECAKFADAHQFCAVWTPERHFQEFGGLYPNPSVLGAALAMITERVQIRAGSVAVPLHNPVRIAEEWSVVDNLSHGRVGISLASGWHPLDFVLAPESYRRRKDILFDTARMVQDLWAGKAVQFSSVDGADVAIKVLPRPIQRRLPIWVTIAENTESWRRAGEIGAHVLTAIVQQPIEALASKIKLYREARERAGHDPATGQVAVMLHTFVGEDDAAVKELVRPHLARYFGSNIKQLQFMKEIFEKELRSRVDFDPDNIDDSDLQAVGAYAFERYFETSLLCGAREKCARLIDRLVEAGVNEAACLVDFGVQPDLVIDSLRHLNLLRISYAARPASTEGEEMAAVGAQGCA